jgi:hypothetical protein
VNFFGVHLIVGVHLIDCFTVAMLTWGRNFVRSAGLGEPLGTEDGRHGVMLALRRD